MHLLPSKILTFTDATTGAVIFSAPMPCLAQIEACIRLEPASAPQGGASAGAAHDGAGESSIARQRRFFAQCLVLLCPPVTTPWHLPTVVAAWRHRRRARAWLRSLQYPQLLDVYRKLMLAVQGVDFETLEDFERALEAQKKSTPAAPTDPATRSSTTSASSPSV